MYRIALPSLIAILVLILTATSTAGLIVDPFGSAGEGGNVNGQTFEDYLTCVRCALAGGQMEDDYLATVHKGYDKGSKGKRGIDALTAVFGRLVELMEETRKDILDD